MPTALRSHISPRYRGSSTQQGYGQAWRRLRAQILFRDPICRDESGCDKFSTDVDHVISRARGGTDDSANLRGLCHAHHSRKTATQDGGFGR